MLATRRAENSTLFQVEGHFERSILIAKNVLHFFIQFGRSLIDEFEIASFDLGSRCSLSFEALDVAKFTHLRTILDKTVLII